jgi:hypothetical protein
MAVCFTRIIGSAKSTFSKRDAIERVQDELVFSRPSWAKLLGKAKFVRSFLAFL